MTRRRSFWIVAGGLLVLLLLAAGLGKLAAGGSKQSVRHTPFFMTRGTEADAPTRKASRRDAGARLNGPNQQAYANQAFPRKFIRTKQVLRSRSSFMHLPFGHVTSHGRRDAGTFWQELGPSNGSVSGFLAGAYIYGGAGQATTVSGRVTAMAINPSCVPGNCVLYVGAAGGGIWKTTNALAANPVWQPKSAGLPSMAIGSIAMDPHNARILYVGTGEPNGSVDSEAGLGLYKSTDAGNTWHSVSSTHAIADSRSIGTIAIDPNNSRHILIGTDVARHGMAGVNGGRFTPPGAPPLAVYETTDGGATWNNVLQLAQDGGQSAGVDLFAGGITRLMFDPNDNSTVYASSFSDGIYRRIGAGSWEQIFHANNPADDAERSMFTLSNNGGVTRVWAASGDANNSTLWRVNDATDASASDLLASQDTPTGDPTSWKRLDSSTETDPGFTSSNFCHAQCWYDMVLESPPGGSPSTADDVAIGGSMDYGSQIDNQAAVLYSFDGGVTFNDMTADNESPPRGMHPDQHALVFDPNNPNVIFTGSDGGVMRTNGTFVDQSSTCSSRPGLSANDIMACQNFLAATPTTLYSLNKGLRDLQFQNIAASPARPTNSILGGTQDNGTWDFTCGAAAGSCSTFETIFGDGGTPSYNVGNASIRTHEYTGAQFDVNFHGSQSNQWDWISDPFYIGGENNNFSFYSPFISDPVNAGTMFTGGAHVWRTLDNGGSQAYLDTTCNEFTGTFATTCGDWVTLDGSPNTADAGNLICTNGAITPSCPYTDNKGGSYIAALSRAPSDSGTLWVGTRRGRIFVSTNADAASPASVAYDQIDTATQPRRFPSGIVVDPTNPDHALISFSGYAAYTPGQPGHVFDVVYNPGMHSATWTDLTNDLGDIPATAIQENWATGDIYVGTDWGVMELPNGTSHWVQAGHGLPPTAVYSLYQAGPWIYAGTHGRGVWRLRTTP